MGFAEEQLKRSALGRTGIIGELYDARTESFTSRSLFKSSLPQSIIKTRDISKTDINYKIIENSSDRFDLLEVEAALQLNLMCGLLNVEGSGKFLTEDTKSNKKVSCSLVCKFFTLCEKVFASFEEMLPYVDMSALADADATHVVVEVNWGANCLLTLESKYSSSSEKTKIEGVLSGQLSWLKQALKANGYLKKENAETTLNNNIDIKVCVDVLPDKGLPTSVETFFQFISNIPNLMKNVNEGKGKPLNYLMTPLAVFRKISKLESAIEVVVASIDDSFVMSTVFFLEEIASLQKRFYDLIVEVTEYQKCMNEEVLKNLKEKRQELMMKESEVKVLISENLISVRSGDRKLKDLIVLLENFKRQNLKMHTYENYLDSLSFVEKKISEVKLFISLGVKYLGRGDNFSSILSNYPLQEFVVFTLSHEFEKNDADLYQKTIHYFVSLARNPNPNTVYVVIDFDFQPNKRFLKYELSTAKCFHLKGSDVVSMDMYEDYTFYRSSNFMRPIEKSLVSLEQHKPGNRVLVEMTCPGFREGDCSPNKLKWHCIHCQTHMEYGFDGFFYCSCRKSTIQNFEFRCSDLKHGNNFIYSDSQFLNEQLGHLKPLKELNIAILGQSGVGKSTWINSIVNYLAYDSLETAKESGVLCEIPVSVEVYPPQVKEKKTIVVGNQKDAEVIKAGDSATQSSNTYTFLWEDTYVRLIDTPGIGDTRGIQQDKENIKNIISHLGQLKELHAICILIKANDYRLNSIFTYCIKELLVHLHKSLIHNIVFCFTNSRISFYNPGKACTILTKLFDSLNQEQKIVLGHHNMFCLDNEAFLFLCTLNIPEITYDQRLVQSFSQSWEIATAETNRMLHTIKSFKPHPVKETLSLVTARYKILTLAKPLAEINKTIQMNVIAIKNKSKIAEESEQILLDLANKKYVTQYRLEAESLGYPVTVCTTPTCVKYHKYPNMDVTEIQYKTICHDRCYVADVEPKTTNNYLLKNCWAMTNGNCRGCGCTYNNHMHITFTQKIVETQCVDEAIENRILMEKSNKEKVEDIIKYLVEKTEKYKKEQEIITKTSAKFGIFLKQNAISVYNDSFAEYLKHLINEEQNKPYKSEADEQILQNLRNTLSHYNSELSILQNVINNGKEIDEMLTPQDIFKLEDELFKLELTGEQIKKCVEINRWTVDKYSHYSETPLVIKKVNKNYSNKNKQKTKKESKTNDQEKQNDNKWFPFW